MEIHTRRQLHKSWYQHLLLAPMLLAPAYLCTEYQACRVRFTGSNPIVTNACMGALNLLRFNLFVMSLDLSSGTRVPGYRYPGMPMHTHAGMGYAYKLCYRYVDTRVLGKHGTTSDCVNTPGIP